MDKISRKIYPQRIGYQGETDDDRMQSQLLSARVSIECAKSRNLAGIMIGSGLSIFLGGQIRVPPISEFPWPQLCLPTWLKLHQLKALVRILPFWLHLRLRPCRKPRTPSHGIGQSVTAPSDSTGVGVGGRAQGARHRDAVRARLARKPGGRRDESCRACARRGCLGCRFLRGADGSSRGGGAIERGEAERDRLTPPARCPDTWTGRARLGGKAGGVFRSSCGRTGVQRGGPRNSAPHETARRPV